MSQIDIRDYSLDIYDLQVILVIYSNDKLIGGTNKRYQKRKLCTI